MATITLVQVEKKFGDFQAVKPIDLIVDDGEFVVLLGPSGCGKTTTLRMISGLETVTGGRIYIDDRDVTWHHPSDRDIAFVFQLYALYPHMNVRRNIVFPLEAQGEDKGTIERRLAEVVELLRCQHLLTLHPGALSGGDQQRVALARALVRRPAAFLMDEPLGALDADFRETMRAEIKQLHINQNATTVYVTHDQIEAMAMGDRIVVMSEADIQQVGSPSEVYYDPSNTFVARFIGSPGMNLIEGHYLEGIAQLAGDSTYQVPENWRSVLDRTLKDKKVLVGFRPEAGQVKEDGAINAEVYADELHGAHTMLHLSLRGDASESIIHVRARRGLGLKIGEFVKFDISPEMVRFFDAESGKAIVAEV
ncbi:MAG: ABC transporter ATP-binding protein [Anaerolineae bacterium]|nr:MAG: ABC transporter ATP-binding protein [Anaerolineae bacterium]